jgi:hypothetical protein
MNNTDTINMIVAIYGAIVATAGFFIAMILGIIEYRRNQPQVKVRLAPFQIWSRSRNNSAEKYLSIIVANLGTRPITVTSFNFLSKQRHILVLPDYLVEPFKLNDGESHDILIPIDSLADKGLLNMLWKVRVTDATGKVWATNFSKKDKKWILENAMPDK